MEPNESPPAAPTASATWRGFLGLLTVVLGAVPIVGGLFATLRSGLAPAASDKPKRFPLCKLEEVPAVGVKQVSVSYQMRQGAVVESVAKVVFVTRDPANKNHVLALAGECTHLSCPVQNRELQYDGDKKAPLTCPCHGGMFSQTGEVLAGPPERPLRRLKLEKQPEKPTDIIVLSEI